MRRTALLLVLALCLGPACARLQAQAKAATGPVPGEPNIGWCCFFPGADVGMDQLPSSGAAVLSVLAGGWGMEPSEGKYDFSAFDRQLEYARKNGLKLALIEEINPVYTPAWLQAKAKAAGQTVRNGSGVAGDIPSITSPLFQAAQEDLVRKFAAHVRESDTTGVVTHYHPGAEWWFPMDQRYNPADIARFRGWLKECYRTPERLNARWGASFHGFEAVPAPALEMSVGAKNRAGMGAIMALDAGAQHCSWSTPAAMDATARPGPDTFAAVEPGRRYTVSAWVKTEETTGFGAFLEIAWVRAPERRAVVDGDGRAAGSAHGWTRIASTFKAPKEAGRAWILLKFMGAGTVRWDDVELRADGETANLAPNPDMEAGAAEPGAWRFQNWSGGKRVTSRRQPSGGRGGGACLEIVVPASAENARPYRNLDAAVYDWSRFWYETGADYIDSMARLVRKYDPTRPTVTYLTMSFAYPVEWDYSQMYAIAPDEVAMRGRDIDVFGLQTCSADGDAFRVTACLDLVRKYGKPVWTVDLVDFTSGVAIGFPAMNRVTQSAIQHGAKGIIYCAWHIPTVPDYSFHPKMAPANRLRMLTEARAAVKLLEGLRVRARTAIVQPILPASPNDAEGFKNDYRSFLGWYKLLQSLGLTVDIVTLREIETGRADLSQYQSLLVPDCAYLPETARDRLADYARRGGHLITGGRFALKNEIGVPLAARRIALWTLPDYGRAYAGDPLRDTHAGNTPPLFLWRKETQATREAFARGRAALKPLLAAAGSAGGAVLLTNDGSLSSVEYEGAGSTALYLVNGRDTPTVAKSVRLRVPSGTDRIEVYADTRRAPSVRRKAGILSLPSFRTSCLVRFFGKRGPMVKNRQERRDRALILQRFRNG